MSTSKPERTCPSSRGVRNVRRLLRGSALIRLAFGVSGLLAPARLCVACGMRSEDVTTETEFLMRVFAGRDVLLALQHGRASFDGDDAALRALGGAALTGLTDTAAIGLELGRRRAVSGALRAGVGFAATDGIGFPLAWLLATRAAAAGHASPITRHARRRG